MLINQEPTFVLTADQDWAPEWCMEAFLSRITEFDIPVHLFCTNPSKAFDQSKKATWTQGWHPNFQPSSTQGKNPTEVIKYLEKHFPGCRTVRSHCYHEDTATWQLLSETGIVADSQLLTFFEPELKPIRHHTGILRFPVYFEDDIFLHHFENNLSIEAIRSSLFSPGLKILNFHPVFVAANIPSLNYYNTVKQSMFSETSSEPKLRWIKGDGIDTLFEEIVREIQQAGYTFQSFEQVIGQYS